MRFKKILTLVFALTLAGTSSVGAAGLNVQTHVAHGWNSVQTIDVAQKMQTELTGKEITNIQYGYYVSYYDENAVSKSASAIPCYMVITDSGYKYYYDAINGKSLKQEE